MQAKKDFPEARLLIVTADESGTIKLGTKDHISLMPAYEFCE